MVVAPAAISDVVVRSSAPTWYSGPQASPRSALVKPNSTRCAKFFHAKFAWVSMTPFGRPVVPDVYISRCTSSPATWTRGGTTAAARSSVSGVHPSACPAIDTRSSVFSMPFVASFARSSSASSHTSARASECSRMYRTSGAASRQLIGIAIAPRWLAAKIVSRNSMQLYDSKPTTSPMPTPRSWRPAASAPERSTISPYVTVSSPNTASGMLGVRRAWCSSTTTQLMSGFIGGRARLDSSGSATAPSSRRRRRAQSPSSSGTRRSRDTSKRPSDRRLRQAQAGCLAAIASIASCGSSAWMPERKVPGHTQFTRIPSRAYSTAATFASWITAAFVAQYGAACDHAVRPATEAVSTIDPDCCVRMTAPRRGCR